MKLWICCNRKFSDEVLFFVISYVESLVICWVTNYLQYSKITLSFFLVFRTSAVFFFIMGGWQRCIRSMLGHVQKRVELSYSAAANSNCYRSQSTLSYGQ